MTENLRGILAVLIGSFAFVLNDAFVKLVSAELPSGEIIVLRGVLATIMLTGGAIAMGAMRPLRLLLTPMMIVRLAAAAGATAFIVLSVRYLPLAIVNCVLQVTPLAVTAGAAVVYGEKVGWRRWAAALAGFLGVVLIVQPGGGTFGAAAVLLLIALCFTTLRDLTTRGIHAGVPSTFVAAGSAASITLSGFAIAPFDAAWSSPSSWAWGLMTLSAACQFIANILVIMALRTGEIAVVAPFRYGAVPLSIFLGWLWWGDVPNALSTAGIGLVMAAGLYTLHRERHGLKLVRAPAAAAVTERSITP
ncbi:MAG TPA: DMT family transporter [Hyphomicrobiaceae bacterium]|nr:DMT family transporter [Hyphomicrobiaceae bacterium]